MSQAILEKNIIKTLGLNTLSDEEQILFFQKVGATILELSLVKLAKQISGEQRTSLEYYLATNPEPDVLMDHLLGNYSVFENILEEEIIAFKEDALAVLGEKVG